MTELNFGNNTVEFGRYDATQSQQVPLARLVLIGRTERGPVGVPTVVPDVDGFAAIFGEGSDLAGTAQLYQEAQAFKNEAGADGDMLVLRLYQGTTGTAAEAAGTNKLSFAAAAPGAYGNGLQRAVVKRTVSTVTVLDVYIREVRNGLTVRNRTVTDVPLTVDGIAALNLALDGLVAARFDPLGTTDVASSTADGAALEWVSLTGGADSAALTAATWKGAVNPDTQERSGLYTLRTTAYGGPVIIAESAATTAVRELLYDYAASTAGIYLDGPATDVLPAAAATEKSGLEGLFGSESVYYVYPRGRDKKGPLNKPRSALGYVAGKIVSGINRSVGQVAPPMGAVNVPEVQRSPNGRDALAHEGNAKGLNKAGIATLMVRGNGIELQGSRMVTADPRQPETDRIYERMTMMALTYALGPMLSQFGSAYIDSKGAFYNVVRGKIRDRIKPYWQSGVLFGGTPEEAFDVKIDFELNPVETLTREGRAKCRVKVKTSPVADGIDLAIFNIPISQAF